MTIVSEHNLEFLKIFRNTRFAGGSPVHGWNLQDNCSWHSWKSSSWIPLKLTTPSANFGSLSTVSKFQSVSKSDQLFLGAFWLWELYIRHAQDVKNLKQWLNCSENSSIELFRMYQQHTFSEISIECTSHFWEIVFIVSH